MHFIKFTLQLLRQAESIVLPKNDNYTTAPQKSRLLKRVCPRKKVNTGLLLAPSVGQKLLLIHASSDKTDCIQHTVKPSPQGWKTRARAVSDYGQLAGGKYNIVPN